MLAARDTHRRGTRPGVPAHVVASDAHGTDSRLSAFVNLLGRLDPQLAETVEPLVTTVPAQLLANEDVTPDIPARLPRGGRRLSLPFGPRPR